MTQEVIQRPMDDYYPIHKLDESERKDPYLVIHDLFSFAHLPELRTMLWEFLKATVTGTYGEKISSDQRNYFLHLYEHMERLIEASHILNQRRKRKYNKQPLAFKSEFLNDNAIRNLSHRCVFLKADDWKYLIKTVVQIGNAEQVYLVDYPPASGNSRLFDLLVVRVGKESQIQKDVSAAPKDLQHCELSTVWTENAKRIQQLMQKGHIFFTTVCRTQYLLYDTGRVRLPEGSREELPAAINKAQSSFDASQSVAGDFWAGAAYYASVPNPELTAFMLHQTAIHALRALLYALTPYERAGQNLEHLLQMIRHLAPELCEVFPRNNPAEEEIFIRLKNAYAPAKYRSSYRFSDADMKILFERVGDLRLRSQQVFERRILALEKSLTQS